MSDRELRQYRPIRSFVRREGRLTTAQRRALTELWPRFGVVPGEGGLNLEALFGRQAPCTLEIGFGDGLSLLQQAKAHPERNYLGIEVHRPGVGRMLIALERAGIENVRVVCEDAVAVLQHNIPDSSLACVQLFFPDPWPKKRHHKRRIVQPAFVQLVQQKLLPGGHFHLATDWEEYAWHMMEVLSAVPGLRNIAGPGMFSSRPVSRPLTKFEQRGQRLGHGVWDLIFERQ